MEQYLEFIGNHPYMMLALAATLGMIAFSEYQQYSNRPFSLEPLEFSRLSGDGKTVLVDIRKPALFEQSHIVGAINISLGNMSTQAVLDQLRLKHKGKKIVVYCQNGSLSPRARSTLAKKGLDPVFFLAGGIAAWKKMDLPFTEPQQKS